MECHAATKRIFHLLTSRCTSRGWSRRRSNGCGASWIQTQSDIWCFEGRRANSTLFECFTSWNTPRSALLCFTLLRAEPPRTRCAEGGRFERKGLRDDALRAILPVSEVLHVYAADKARQQSKAEDIENIHESKEIGTVCGCMVMHYDNGGNAKACAVSAVVSEKRFYLR